MTGGWWTERVVPRLVDASLSQEPVGELRARACAGLHGRILEIGFGSGLNLPHLPAAVTGVDAVEPADLAWQRSAQRRGATAVPVRRTGLDGQALAVPDASYDAVLCTFSLSTHALPAALCGERPWRGAARTRLGPCRQAPPQSAVRPRSSRLRWSSRSPSAPRCGRC